MVMQVMGKVSHSVTSGSLRPSLHGLWTVAHQAPLSMELSRQEHWSRWPVTSPGNLPDPGTESVSPSLKADSLLFEAQKWLHIQMKLHWLAHFSPLAVHPGS